MTTDNPGITKGCPLTVELEGTSCQFVLYVNAYGEIVHLENHFLALPAEAQQLIAGSAAGRIAEKLKSYELLLRYLTPIAALGYMEEEQWKAIYRETTTLNHKLSEQPDNQQPLPNAWTRQIRQLHQDPEKQGVLSLAAEFIHINTQGFSEFLLHRIGETKEMIFEPLLHVVLNVLDSESLILLCYQDIGHYQTENSRLLLTTHLVDKHYARYRNRILTALGNYQDDAIRAFLLKFYHEKRQIEGIDWEPWIIALKPYNGPEVNAAFLDLMTGINSNSALEAFAALHTNGYSEVDLLPHLLRVIREKRSKRHVKCALNTLDQIEDTALLPTADELISIFIWDCESIADDQQDLGQNIRELLTRRKNENAFTRLYPYLRHSDPEIRERTLELLAIGEAADRSADRGPCR